MKLKKLKNKKEKTITLYQLKINDLDLKDS